MKRETFHVLRNIMDDILQRYRDSLADNVFSRKEKQAMLRLVRDRRYDKDQLAWLRSQIFNLAREHATQQNLPVILDWLEIANKTLLADRTSNEVCFSPGDECWQAIVRHLESAGATIRICVFTISDDRLSDTIVQCARNSVRVQIISDNEKTYDSGSDIRRLVAAGIDVRVDYTDHHMHHKFAIIDERTVMTGSYNWTRSAARYNHENLLITEDKMVVEEYLKEFQQLWRVMKPYHHQ